MKVLAYLDQLLEALSGVNCADLLSKYPVENLGDGVSERPGEHHHQSGHVDGLGSDGKAVPRAECLWGDLAEDDDGQSRADNRHQSRGQVVHDDSKSGVDHDVTEEDGAEEVVTVGSDWQDLLGVGSLSRRA